VSITNRNLRDRPTLIDDVNFALSVVERFYVRRGQAVLNNDIRPHSPYLPLAKSQWIPRRPSHRWSCDNSRSITVRVERDGRLHDLLFIYLVATTSALPAALTGRYNVCCWPAAHTRKPSTMYQMIHQQ